MRSKLSCIAAAVFFFAFAAPGRGDLRELFDDATVVGRADLIFVGHIVPESIKYIEHPKRSDGVSMGGEYAATLVVARTLKGVAKQREITIMIYDDDLQPKVGGESVKAPRKNVSKQEPKDRVEILDTNDSSFGIILTQKAQGDNLWFLRLRSHLSVDPGQDLYGVKDPEDMQPLALENYFRAYLTKNPDEHLKGIIARKAAGADRAQKYFDHLAVQRILSNPDPAGQLDGLLPFALKKQEWKKRLEADEAIEKAFPKADAKTRYDFGMKLVAMLNDPKFEQNRVTIIWLFGETRFQGSVQPLIDLLKQHDRFWAEQKIDKPLTEDWWRRDSKPETKARYQVYNETCTAIMALERLKNPRAWEAVKMTRDRWRSEKLSNSNLVKDCDKLLDDLQM